MNKADVVKLCEADQKLQWWAMVLFAEICELVEDGPRERISLTDLYAMIASRVERFPRVVIQRQLEKVDGSD